MRRVAVASLSVVLLLLTAACGSAVSEPSADPGGSGTSTVVPVPSGGASLPGASSGQQALDSLVAGFGDESTATGVVLLAADRGYVLPQIVEAAVAGRLTADGQVQGADGVTVPPDGAASDLLVDDLAAVRVDPASLRTDRSTWPVSEVVRRLEESGRDHGPLILVLGLLDSGYDAEQITLALMADGATRFDERSFGYQLLDAEGGVVVPAGPSLGIMREALADVLGITPEPPGSATGSGGTATTPPEAQFADLVRRAAGEYLLTEDLAATLLNLPGVQGVESTEGSLTVTPEAQVSGGFSYTLTGTSQFGASSWSIAVLLPTSALEPLDDGLTFSVVAQVDEPAPGGGVRRVEQPATGYVDVDLGLITVTFAGDFDVTFQR
ncbi:MAG: hypothetical protein R2737_10730 [Candidatus Nanopelagicales bacterium]